MWPIVPTFTWGLERSNFSFAIACILPCVKNPFVSLLQSPGADDRDRTGDLVLTKDVLYQLSYIGLRAFGASADKSATSGPPPRGNPAVPRPQPLGLPSVAASAASARRRMERETGIEPATNSLEGCDSTTELLPPSLTARYARNFGWQARPAAD